MVTPGPHTALHKVVGIKADRRRFPAAAFWGMWVCFPVFLVTILIDCCVCWKGWMNKSTVDSWVH